MREALYYEKLPDGVVRCLLCPQGCKIPEGKTGLCSARRNTGGMLMAESWARVTSLALDPIEKKPLRRFHPGCGILSAGSYGCNLRCPFCQNHSISTGEAEWRRLLPAELAAASLSLAGQNNIGVAFTYNEPLTGYEYVLDTAKLLRAQGQKVVLVTNGYIREEPLRELLPLVDAMNIDLKGFRANAYDWLGGKTEPVKQVIQLAAGFCHVEVTSLIVPGRNDSPGEMEDLAAWLASIRKDIPLHVSRYFPRHRMDAPATPVETICGLAKLADKRLKYVYTGNV